MDNILTLEKVQTYIGRFHILFDINLNIRRNAATVLIGRNGAGKTTTLETIMGLRPASSGKIIFDGTDISKMVDYMIARQGIGYVPEDREIFSTLTVEENLLLSARDATKFRQKLEVVCELFPDIKKYLKSKAGILSGGQAQMLSISRALMSDNKLIVIDEPSKGLAPIVIESLIEKINEIKKNCTILLVEQNLEMAMAIGDYFYIVEEGQTVAYGDRATLVKDDMLIKKHLGV